MRLYHNSRVDKQLLRIENPLVSSEEVLAETLSVYSLIHLDFHMKELKISFDAVFILLIQCRDCQDDYKACRKKEGSKVVLLMQKREMNPIYFVSQQEYGKPKSSHSVHILRRSIPEMMLKTNALGKIIYEAIKIGLQMQHCNFLTLFNLVISHIFNENLHQYIDFLTFFS